MKASLNTNLLRLDKILVIDDMPLVAPAFQEVFRQVNDAASVEYTENILTALSSKKVEHTPFDLIISGSFPDTVSENLRAPVAELKKKFGTARIMVYASTYDPLIIEKMEESG